MSYRRTREADTETTHEIPETHNCLRANDKTNAMIHGRNTDKDTILENAARNNKTDWFNFSHLAMTGDKNAKI